MDQQNACLVRIGYKKSTSYCTITKSIMGLKNTLLILRSSREISLFSVEGCVTGAVKIYRIKEETV